MIKVQGKYNCAVCYCEELEETARQQIQDMCDQRIFAGSKIRIMPDVHAGAGCTIGTTMTISDKAAPSLVGVDVGCGMETVKLGEKEVDFDRLDRVIRTRIPSGQDVREKAHPLTEQIDLRELHCMPAVDLKRAVLSLGTLGGGNHFIEIDRDEDGCLYLVIHSGSRSLGRQTSLHYQKHGKQKLSKVTDEARYELIHRYKKEGRADQIEKGLRELNENFTVATVIPERFAYLTGSDLDEYLQDMKLIQQFAELNRKAITQTILEGMGWTETDRFTTIHNYIDTENRILRKGSVSAQKGERLLIPINMRDGALICVGKGNPEWNYSAPHGAGRVLSRRAAHESLSMEQFRKEMQGIYTTCIAESTLDESPMAYKERDAIVSQIEPTAEIVKQIKPVYNYKAGT